MTRSARRDILDDDRRHLPSDPLGESVAHVDANALPNLLLQTLGRGGHQPARVRVVQQNHRRIHAQQLPGAIQQLVEEGLDIQLRQGGIGDRLDAPQVFVAAALDSLDHSSSVALPSRAASRQPH